MPVKKIKLKDFDVDFDLIKIVMPDGEGLKVRISEQLLVNQALPADLMSKMAQCASKYARWGVVRGDLLTYSELLNDEYSMFIRRIKSVARSGMDAKVTEGKIEEKAILNNVEEYTAKRKKIRQTNSALEKVKRVMKAFEIQSELMRSIKAKINKEEKMFEEENPIITENKKSTSLSAKK